MVAKIDKTGDVQKRDDPLLDPKMEKPSHPVLGRTLKTDQDADDLAKKASGYSRMHHRHNRS